MVFEVVEKAGDGFRDVRLSQRVARDALGEEVAYRSRALGVEGSATDIVERVPEVTVDLLQPAELRSRKDSAVLPRPVQQGEQGRPGISVVLRVLLDRFQDLRILQVLRDQRGRLIFRLGTFGVPARSEERRVGTACVSTGRSRWS